MADKNLTIIEHIDEVRKRLMVIVVFFTVGVIASFFFAKPLINFIQYDTPAEQVVLNAFNVIDPVVIYLKVIIFLAIVIISPVIMYQFWAFISPGLRDLERKVTLSYIPFAFLLFLAGISFSYFVLLPYIMKFMINLSAQLNIEQTIGINEYFSFLFSILLPFGFVFQLPIVILFLSRLGVLEPKVLVKVRKFAYFGLFVLAAFITPPDIVSHLFVTLPLFVLYEISIIISRLGYRKFEKAERLHILEEIKAEQQRQIDEVLNRTDKQ
ncbi:twin-arginine translocase subunit TatC [Sporosarcina sp.]|uniref:twin-arginine translocase subunit TatC n=1 Tax=Sporosarcina sp. TaxID=49982 RepID=UPI002609C671|nr:twin-arginine translocase subunit TatC [Sporosarcina sp.]